MRCHCLPLNIQLGTEDSNNVDITLFQFLWRWNNVISTLFEPPCVQWDSLIKLLIYTNLCFVSNSVTKFFHQFISEFPNVTCKVFNFDLISSMGHCAFHVGLTIVGLPSGMCESTDCMDFQSLSIAKRLNETTTSSSICSNLYACGSVWCVRSRIYSRSHALMS